MNREGEEAQPHAVELLEALFHRALEIPTEERRAWLDRRCEGSPRLLSEILALLEADELDASEGVVEGAVEDGLQLLRAAGELPSNERAGAFMGSYRILREIGRGGTGTVYLAERSDGRYEKSVAVKVPHRGSGTEELLSRFATERRILAGLDHPNIARLLDAGSAEDGQPFFVLEHVEGEPLDRYCEERGLSLEARLKLFRTICGAVQFAHRNLVIHRDLKPGNILVTPEGEPKLLDFGIAKLWRSEGEAGDESPAAGRRPMTPRYASPEQVAGEPLTTATDVYSLGVVLYRLLAGVHPYDTDCGAAELERRICQVEPRRPSEHVSGRSRRRLEGDLDHILLMALAKSPHHRYSSAEQLSEDLRRFLEGLPVRARRPTLLYRGGKFLRRHRIGAAMTAALLALIAVFALSTLAQHRRTALEAAKAARTLEFLTEMFELSEPARSQGRTITAREILDRGAERIGGGEFSDQPEVQAELLATVGRVYSRLALFEEARPLLEKALALRRSFASEADLAVSLEDLANVWSETGELEEAEALYRQAFDLRRKTYGERHPAVATSLNQLAGGLFDLGRYQEAEPLYLQALELREGLFGEEHAQVATTVNDLAVLYHQMGELERAEPLYRRALRARRRALGPHHPDLVTSLNNLAIVQRQRGNLDESEVLAREAVTIARQVFGKESFPLTGSLNVLARLQRDRGDFGGAEETLREVLAIQEEHQAGEHSSQGTTLHDLGRVMEQKGELKAARELFERALGVYRRTLPERHPWTAFPLLALGRVLTEAGEAAAAEPWLREALAVRRESLPDSPWRIGEVESALGHCLAAQGRLEEGAPLMQHGHGSLLEALGSAHPSTRRAQESLERYGVEGESSGGNVSSGRWPG